LLGCGLDTAVWRDLFEFYHVGFVPSELKHVIYPVGSGVRVGSWIVDPVSCLDGTGKFSWAPRDADRGRRGNFPVGRRGALQGREVSLKRYIPKGRVKLQLGMHYCRTPTLAKCGGEAQHLEKSGVGVLRDSRMFRARQ
jgi:hypothetical protein